MIYKILEDTKWEYKVIKIQHYELMHNQMNSMCNGDEGWEAYHVEFDKDENGWLVFLKRSYKEIDRNFSE